MPIGAGAGIALVAIGGYCAVKLRELADYAHHIGRDSVGIYSECHAGRRLSEEALRYIRRREAYSRSMDPAYDEFDASPDEDVAVSLAELNAALESLQRAVSIQDCELGAHGEACDE